MKKIIPYHIGIIPDGNRRHSKRDKITLTEAYIKGADIALETVSWARAIGVKHISFFGTSNENVLCRPNAEIKALRLGVLYFCEKIISQGLSLHIVGDIEEMGQTPEEKKVFKSFKKLSSHTGPFVVHADVNYSGELSYELKPLFHAIAKHGLKKVQKNPELFIASAHVPAIDLVIRTGGRPRLSGFLPFQTIYSELFFADALWADFDKNAFDNAVSWFTKQERTKGT